MANSTAVGVLVFVFVLAVTLYGFSMVGHVNDILDNQTSDLQEIYITNNMANSTQLDEANAFSDNVSFILQSLMVGIFVALILGVLVNSMRNKAEGEQ